MNNIPDVSIPREGVLSYPPQKQGIIENRIKEAAKKLDVRITYGALNLRRLLIAEILAKIWSRNKSVSKQRERGQKVHGFGVILISGFITVGIRTRT